MEEDLKSKTDQACRTAEDFIKLYYDSVDKRRYLMSRLYMDDATLIWNGNGVKGKEQIQSYWTELPATDHSVVSLDAQPIIAPSVSGQLSFLVRVSGQVKYQEQGFSVKSFNQIFLVTAMKDRWKIVSDCFRTQEALDS
ncbi:NTF2-related export protein-like [Phymastichus coffea]|uniref:NTF2-related export protein-like n=1 Tax=Phymastichus coffea TaxID=108790 RepID=UPI00273C3431|nr:NTF2-related export protein-like [Phymastichus coffea]